jgi:hypothetical protein
MLRGIFRKSNKIYSNYMKIHLIHQVVRHLQSQKAQDHFFFSLAMEISQAYYKIFISLST